MSLTERLANPAPKHPAGRSRLDEWADKLPTDERDAVYNAATNPEWGHVALLRALVEEGAPNMSDTSFRSWRVKNGFKVES